MSPKAFVRQIVDEMPDDASLADIVDQIRLEVSLEQAEQDIRDGKWSPRDDVKARAREWRKGYQ